MTQQKPSATALEIHDLTVAYQEKPVLWDVDFIVPQGTLAAVVGPNGAGKSTLLKAIVGLVKPLAGCISIFGRPFKQVRHHIAYVPQRNSVDWDFPVNVLDVVMMGSYGRLGFGQRPGRRERDEAMECLKTVGMEDLAHRHISELSGGQQQRVFLARAFMQQARLFLMDEPFAGIDAVTESSLVAILKTLKKDGKTVVCVHHDLQTIEQYFDWVLLLNIRGIAQGPVAEVMTPHHIKTAYGGHALFIDAVTQKD